MVLWELTLATAYFLGLKRTYRLALKIQRKIINPKHTRTRQFAHRQTRAVFDVAVRVHKNIQVRDLEVGRNLGNRILRWLDRMKPSAEIRPKPPQCNSPSSPVQKQLTDSTTSSTIQKNGVKGQESDRHFFTSMNILPKSIPIVGNMVQPTKSARINTQYRHLSFYAPRINSKGVFREDISQWMLRN